MTNTKQCQNCKYFQRMAPEQGNCVEGGEINRVDMLFTCEKFEMMERGIERGATMDEIIIEDNGKMKNQIINKTMNELKNSKIESYEKKQLKNGMMKLIIYYEEIK